MDALRKDPADLERAKQMAAESIQAFRGRMDAYMQVVLESFPWVIVGAIAGPEASQELRNEILKRMASTQAQKPQASKASQT